MSDNYGPRTQTIVHKIIVLRKMVEDIWPTQCVPTGESIGSAEIMVLRKMIEDTWLIECSIEIMVEHKTEGEHKTFILVTCHMKDSVITLGLLAIGIEET